MLIYSCVHIHEHITEKREEEREKRRTKEDHRAIRYERGGEGVKRRKIFSTSIPFPFYFSHSVSKERLRGWCDTI